MGTFKTFFIGGYECSDHLNAFGERINLLQETAHDQKTEEDYQLLSDLGIKTVRESICWSSVEKEPYRFDFSEVSNRIEIADRQGIQQIWDLCHFGYPDNLNPMHPEFPERFAALCEAFAFFHKSTARQQLYVVPINEISLLSRHRTPLSNIADVETVSDFNIKYNLCKAAIAGIKRLKNILPDCRVVLVEPLVKIHQDFGGDAEHFFKLNESQFEAMDMIAGRICPELGGEEKYLDILGFNYYWNSQWYDGGQLLEWPEENEARVPLSRLLKMAYCRYNKPLFLSETGHFGEKRADWIEEITIECLKAIDNGVSFEGICIYPVTDRPEHLGDSQCGIWNLDENKNRIPYKKYIKTIRFCMKLVENSRNSLFASNFMKHSYLLN